MSLYKKQINFQSLKMKMNAYKCFHISNKDLRRKRSFKR